MVLLLGLHGREPHSSAGLLLVGVQGDPLDVVVIGNGDDDLLVGYQVLLVGIDLVGIDLRAALVAVGVGHLLELVLDDVQDPLLMGEDVLQVVHQDDELVVLLLDGIQFESGQLLEPHVQDCLRLLRIDAQKVLQT